MKSLFIYCLVFFTTLYILPAQTIIYEKDYPNIPSNIESSIIWGCNIDYDGNLQILGHSEFPNSYYTAHHYIRLFDKDLNLLNHIYIDTSSFQQGMGFIPKLWRFTTTSDGSHYFCAYKTIVLFNFPYFTSKEISKEWQITKDTLFKIRLDSFDIVNALFTADANIVNFGFSNIDSMKNYIMVQRTNKDNQAIWTKHYNLIDTSFLDIKSAYSFYGKDSSMLFFYRPFYKHPNPDSSSLYLFSTCYARFSKDGELIEHKLINPLMYETQIAVNSDRVYTYYSMDSITYKFECWDLEMNNIWSKELHFPEYYSIWLDDYPIANSKGEIVISARFQKDRSSKKQPIILKYDSLGNKLWEKIIKNDDTTRNSILAHFTYDGKSTYIGINRKTLNMSDAGLWKVLKFTEDATGINESVSWQELSCSPNPFSESTRIDFSLEHSSNVNIKVMNLKGETVFSTDYFAESGTQHFDFNASGLVSGTYYIEINTPNNKYHVKAVLQK